MIVQAAPFGRAGTRSPFLFRSARARSQPFALPGSLRAGAGSIVKLAISIFALTLQGVGNSCSHR
jgi:hypothetical protein